MAVNLKDSSRVGNQIADDMISWMNYTYHTRTKRELFGVLIGRFQKELEHTSETYHAGS